ncbi:MAG: ATP synthase F1 subunit epsilon [Aquificaceae bacterium]|nr:MAG: ATP synthase F1 subunit epsilon [Aquificaceae bacterium]
MKKTLYLNVVDTHHEIFHGEITEVTVSGEMGGFTVFLGHAPLLSSLKPGEMHYSTISGEQESLFVSGGIVEVQPNLVTVLADTIIRTEELDAEAAKASMDHAKEKLKTAIVGSKAYEEMQREMEIMKALINLSKTTNRLRIRRY